MIVKTSREIIREALTLANADNSDFTNFFLNTTLLNNAYRDIYDIIVSNTLAFTKEIYVSKETPLPSDCWSVISVTDRNDNPIIQSSNVSHKDGGWWVENNIIKVPYSYCKVRYSTVPDTLTAPDERYSVTLDELPSLASFNSVSYKDGEVTVTSLGSSIPFQNGILSLQDGKLLYNGEDISSQFGVTEDTISVQVDDPYVVVTDSNYDIWIYTYGSVNGQLWNYNCIYGHPTKGTVYALATDDTTGYGMLYVDKDGNQFYAPFVPDTVLEYPNNTLFTLLEYKIAYMYANLLSMSTIGFLEKMVKEATDNFYKQLGPTSNVHRYSNYRRGRGYLYGIME